MLQFIKEKLHLNRLHRKIADWADKLKEVLSTDVVATLDIWLTGLQSGQEILPKCDATAELPSASGKFSA